MNRLIPAVLIFISCTEIISAQEFIPCKFTPLHSLAFFFGDEQNKQVVWPDSVIEEIEQSLSDTTNHTEAMQFLPFAMLEMNTYFKNGIKQEGFYRIIRYSKLFAATFGDSSWLIGMNDFCPATNRMIEQFNAWYENDTMLADLLFTFDRGPYFGMPYVQPNMNLIHVTDSIQFIGTSNKLFIGTYNERHLLFVKDASGAIRDMVQILDDYTEDDVKTLFSEVKCIPIQDFGYSVIVFVSDGICRLYFDETGRLRFYYIL